MNRTVGNRCERGNQLKEWEREAHPALPGEPWPSGPLKIALAHYDRHVPLFEGMVDMAGFSYRAFEVGQTISGRYGTWRHERMLHFSEFDMAELSLSSYLLAKERGAPFTAIPVFSRRLFSLPQLWCRQDAPYHHPRDLAGKRVGLNTFQTTLSVLLKADLARCAGLSWRQLEWVLARSETIDFDMPDNARLQRAPQGRSLVDLLCEGTIDAVCVPHPSRTLLTDPRIRRVVTDPVTHAREYIREFGYYPIMHVIAVRQSVLDQTPELARAAYDAFNQAWDICRTRWDDPNWSWLAWGRQVYEQQQAFNPDLWQNGLAANYSNLEWFVAQSVDQGMLRRPLSVESLFHPQVLDT